MIKAENVSKRYGGVWALRSVSLSVPRGQIAAVIGQNGCGKSTLLSILAGMLAPDSGQVNLNGRAGFLAQGDSLFEELTVWDNLAFWASAAKLPAKQARNSPYIRLLGLEELLRKRVDRLSGGMRRRVAVCTALLHDPDILLLDEPFSGLDMIYRHELCVCLLELRAKKGKTILYTTHSAEELRALSDITLLLADGRIALSQSTGELFQQSEIQDKLLNMIRGGNTDGS